MGAFSAYVFSAGIYLLAAYLIYKWLLSSENMPGFNRLVLMSLYALAFLLPAAPEFSLAPAQPSAEAVGVIDLGAFEVEVAESSTPLWLVAVLWIYIAGMAVCAAATLISLVRLLSIIRRGRRTNVNGYTLILLPQTKLAPFSWMSHIVMSEADYEAAGEMIICHEMSHLRLQHWADLFVAQLVAIILWYNPASWLMRTELRNVHEYQADSSVLSSGADARQYQLLLIKKAVGQRFPSLANSLNHSKLKNRITMMCNQTSSPSRRLRALAIAPALLIAAAAVNIPVVASALGTASTASLSADKVSEKSQTAQEPEVMPQYPGGDAELYKYMATNVRYPAEAMESGTEGRVVVSFTVAKDGKVTEPIVVKSVSPELDAEAIRVVNTMPAWTPATVAGEPVACQMTIPVQFKLAPKTEGSTKIVILKENEDGSAMVVNGKKVVDDVIVIGYGKDKPTKKYEVTGKPTVYVDGKLFTEGLDKIDPNTIESITVRKDAPYQPNGRIDITLKK